ncbi:FecR family protein [Aurantibacter crassamenti]|uniref:FecR family protein n=1 Tax=Aurantibacter crassamenti TaxID=1837375 RepID=UPI00193A09C2|nr:FecR family protein [Aurantibacter crassamenti]MBM1106909.1 FecR family protein [Aurantibacter crassamenti]
MGKCNQSLLEILLKDSSFNNWAKKSNQNDMAFWEKWIREHPDTIETVYTARDIIIGIAFKKDILPEEKINKELNAVLAQISLKKEIEDAKKVIPINRNPRAKFIKYSAVAAIGLLVIVFGNIALNSSSEVTHKTGFGEIINLKLPDGTSVVLNGNSEIKYSKEDTRNIALKGEAYFKVKSIPATKAKFWVNTKDLKVEVYGTQFHVNTREKKTDVLLDEGSIHLVLDNGDTTEMVPGELVSFSKENNRISQQKLTTELPYALWREDTYVFNNITLEEVMKNVKHAYGVVIEFNDEELKHQLLTGGIPNQNLKICLSAIEKSTGTQIVNKDNKLILFKNSNN